MSLQKKKMLLAPILAIALAFLLAGAVSFLPQTVLQSQSKPEPTSSSNTPATPLPTTAVALASTSDGNVLFVLFVVAAIIVGLVAAFLLFSEKNLKKEING